MAKKKVGTKRSQKTASRKTTSKRKEKSPAKEATPSYEERAAYNKAGYLPWLIIVLGVLVLASAYFVGLRAGAASTGTGTTTSTGSGNDNVAGGVYTPAPDGAPQVELFIMSYCPFGLQMQKAFIPVAELLQGKADFKVKWVNYAMHGLKEVQDNTWQYCIQEKAPDKYFAFARCFVEKTDTDACLASVGLSKSDLQECYDAADAQFGIMAGYNNHADWLSGRYPPYKVDQAENQAYGVRGSPTLVINGKQVSAQRSAEAVKEAVCNAFSAEDRPAECDTTLKTTQEQPGPGPIGAGSEAATPAADCGA